MTTQWTTPACRCGILLWVGLATLTGLPPGATASSLAQANTEAAPLPETAAQPLLQAGDRGPQVSQLQLELASLGLYAEPVDGIYGDDTVQAVRSLQENQGLTPDGIVGAQTWRTLETALRRSTVGLPIPMLRAETLTFTPLVVAQPAPPPSALWLALMPLVPIVGGFLTYLHRRLRHQQVFHQQRPRRRSRSKSRPPR